MSDTLQMEQQRQKELTMGQQVIHEQRVLKGEELDQFEQQQKALNLNDFITAYGERNVLVEGTRTVQVPQEPAPQLEAPIVAQAEPSEKQLKKQQKQRQKDIAAAKKKGIDCATEYSIHIVNGYKEYQKEKAKKPPVDPDQDRATCMNFVKTFKVETSLADPQFVGSNLKGVQEYIDEVQHIVDYYQLEHLEELSQMSLTFQEKFANLVQTLADYKRVYDNALLINGLKLGENGLEPVAPAELGRAMSPEQALALLTTRQETNASNVQKMAAVEVEEKLKTFRVEEEEGYQQLRDVFKADEEYSFIEGGEMNTIYQFENMKGFAKMIDEHPEAYARNKASVDKLLFYFRNLTEISARFNTESRAASALAADAERETFREAERRMDKAGTARAELERVTPFIANAIEHFLKGKPLDATSGDIMIKLGIDCPAYEQHVETVAEVSVSFATIFAAKQATWAKLLDTSDFDSNVLEALKQDSRAFMLVRTDESAEAYRYNAELLHAKVQGLAKNREDLPDGVKDDCISEQVQVYVRMFKPFYESVMAVDTDRLRTMTDDELMNVNHELIHLAMENMHLSDCSKTVDPITGKSVKDLVFPTPEHGAVYSSKIILIQNYSELGRAVSMIHSFKRGHLTTATLSEAEIHKLNLGDVEESAATEQILDYAKSMYERAKRFINTMNPKLDAANVALATKTANQDNPTSTGDTAGEA